MTIAHVSTVGLKRAQGDIVANTSKTSEFSHQRAQPTDAPFNKIARYMQLECRVDDQDTDNGCMGVCHCILEEGFWKEPLSISQTKFQREREREP